MDVQAQGHHARGWPREVFAPWIFTGTAPGSGKTTVCQGEHFTNCLFKLVVDEVLAFLPWHPAQSYCRTFSRKGLKTFPNSNV